jgi:hypothetical protein
MRPASETAPHGWSFLRRVFAVNLAWGVILYLLIGENQEANLWINLGSFAAMMLLARAGGWLRYYDTGPWLVEGAAWHFGAVQVANLLVVALGAPHLPDDSVLS